MLQRLMSSVYGRWAVTGWIAAITKSRRAITVELAKAFQDNIPAQTYLCRSHLYPSQSHASNHLAPLARFSKLKVIYVREPISTQGFGGNPIAKTTPAHGQYVGQAKGHKGWCTRMSAYLTAIRVSAARGRVH